MASTMRRPGLRRLPPLSALRAFEAAARRGSFKGAAAELGVTPTAISHQIRQLEAALGRSLFERRTRQVVLTRDGLALFPVMRDAFDAMALAIEDVQRAPARRVATLSATVAFTTCLLVPRADRFRHRNPGWDLRLHASDEPVDLQAGEADMAIRYGLEHDEGLTYLPLLQEAFAPICRPDLKLRDPDDLRDAVLIHFESRFNGLPGTIPTWRAWAERADLPWLDVQAGIICSDENAAIQAARSGQGVALLSTRLVAVELASGALVQRFGPTLDGLSYELAWATKAAARPAVTLLRSWVLAELG